MAAPGAAAFRVYAVAREATWRSVASDEAGELRDVEFT
jgi:hypothetical protein